MLIRKTKSANYLVEGGRSSLATWQLSAVSKANNDTGVLIVGGGQAGLAIGQLLASRGSDFLIVDANPELGFVWRSRWDSLRLFTPAEYDNLPGMQFPGSRGDYPGKDEIADFLQAYAREFDLPVRLNTRITSLTRADDGYAARSGNDEIRADQVVVATGPFHAPFTPPISEQLDPGITQIHSAEYRNPDTLPAGRTLVVGGANSGQQIALELAESRPVEIAVGQKLKALPQRRFGRDIWWWLTLLRLPQITVQSRLGRRLSQRDVVIGGGLSELKRAGVGIRPRVIVPSSSSIKRWMSTRRSSGRPDFASIIPGSRSRASRTSAARCATAAGSPSRRGFTCLV